MGVFRLVGHDKVERRYRASTHLLYRNQIARSVAWANEYCSLWGQRGARSVSRVSLVPGKNAVCAAGPIADEAQSEQYWG